MLRQNMYVSAYNDMRNNDFYTVYERDDGKLSVFKLVDGEWKILRAGGQGGGKLICAPTVNAVEAETILKQWLMETGLPATKYNYVLDFFPDHERIKLPPLKVNGKRFR